MERPPRPVAQPLFTPGSLAIGFLLGASVLAVVACVYGWALSSGLDEGTARAMAFTALVAGNLALIFANRSHELTMLETATHENVAVWWILAGTGVALLAAIYVPALAALFRFSPPGGLALAASAALGFASVLWYDLYKVARRRDVLART
jgi:Ca2+-transporting ATPase